MTYLLITTQGSDFGGYSPFVFDPSNRFSSLFGEDRSITWEQPYNAPQEKAKNTATSSSANTILKAAAVTALVLGAAYVGYHRGFFDGASSMFDTIKDHFEQEAPIANALPSTDGNSLSLEIGTQIHDLTNMSDWKSYFMNQAAKSNALINISVPAVNTTAAWETITQPLTDLKETVTEVASQGYYSARNEFARVAVGATVATVSILWSLTGCMRAARGL